MGTIGPPPAQTSPSTGQVDLDSRGQTQADVRRARRDDPNALPPAQRRSPGRLPGPLLPAAVTVRRDGERRVVTAGERVDLVLPEAGDRVSAELRVVWRTGLATDESLLPGFKIVTAHRSRARTEAGGEGGSQ